MPALTPESETKDVLKVPQSNWYRYSLECGHSLYSRVRLRYEKPGRQHHMIRCPQGQHPQPSEWMHITNMEAVTDEHVSDVHSGTSFILPNRIMRLDNGIPNNGNLFPYTSSKRDY